MPFVLRYSVKGRQGSANGCAEMQTTKGRMMQKFKYMSLAERIESSWEMDGLKENYKDYLFNHGEKRIMYATIEKFELQGMIARAFDDKKLRSERRKNKKIAEMSLYDKKWIMFRDIDSVPQPYYIELYKLSKECEDNSFCCDIVFMVLNIDVVAVHRKALSDYKKLSFME